MSNFTFVLNQDKQPLDPIHPGEARRLLKAGKAAVFRMYPFTIIFKSEVKQSKSGAGRGTSPVVLGFPIRENLFKTKTTPIELKLDPGSKTTGIVLVQNDKVIWAAELTHRGQNIQASLESRSAIRGNRRARKTRYRQARFLNRAKQSGWLAPSLKHRVDTTLTWVNKLIKFAPIGSIVQELVRFDLQQLENPEISGIEYQQGELLGYEVREYLLNKWNRQCTYCDAKDVSLQVEHVKPKANGGTNRISNLCLACDKCNKKKGILDIKIFLAEKPELLRKIQSQLKSPLKDAAAVNSTRWALFGQLKLTGLPVLTGSGGLTKFNRTRLNLPKAHWLDAACAGVVETLDVLTNQPLLIKSQGHGTRQMCRTDKFGFPSRHVPRNKLVRGFQTGDIVKSIVTTGIKKGRYVGRIAVRSSGYFNISTKLGLIQGVSHKYCQIIQCKDGYNYQF